MLFNSGNFPIFLTVFCLQRSHAIPNVEAVLDDHDNGNESYTNIISHTFCKSCLSEDDQEDKNTLNEVHTYAELKHDPYASLPSSFTICSAVMAPYIDEWIPYQLFFTLLGKNGSSWFFTGFKHPNSFYFNFKNTVVEMPAVFPYNWVKSCVSLNTLSGLVQWVIDGILINNNTYTEIKDDLNRPTNLTGKLILGARKSGQKWKAINTRVWE